METNLLKVVLVGCGSIAAHAHLPALEILRRSGMAEPVGLVDLSPDKAQTLAVKHGVAVSGTDWQEVAERTGAQAVSICLPPGPNADVAAQALARGFHVLTEKPPARDLKNAWRLADAARAYPQLVTMVAFNRRFAPLYQRVMESALKLGHPHVFSGRFTRAGLGTAPSDTLSDWITSDGSHALDLAVATLGYPRSISVTRACCGSGPDNVWTVQLHAERGAGVLVFDFAAGRRVERFEISGPGYDATLELPERGEWAQQGQASQTWQAAELTQSESHVSNYGYLGEYQAFVRAIQGTGARPNCDFAYGAQFMQLVEQILACPSGVQRAVPSTPRADAESHSAASGECRQTHIATPASGARPVVAVWQSSNAQARFFQQQRLAALREVCDLRLRADVDPLDRGLADVDALVLGWGAPLLTPELIEQARRLKLVVIVGASAKQAHPDLLLSRGVLLCTTSDAIAQSVAEHCLLGALAGLRQLTDVDRRMHAGKWPSGPASAFSLRKLLEKGGSLPGAAVVKPLARPLVQRIPKPAKRGAAALSGCPWSDLQGQTVGLIGWGHIARHFARLLKPFDCRLLIDSEKASEEELAEHGARRASRGEILGGARVVSVHKGLTPQTQHLIGATELSLLRPGAVLINTARGPIIEEQALTARLRQGDIVAVLDVFAQEPLPVRHPLRKLGNVILTPHNASTTNECYRRVGSQAVDIVERWMAGEPVQTVTSARLERAS